MGILECAVKNGRLAQLVERLIDVEKARGSNPLSSTFFKYLSPDASVGEPTVTSALVEHLIDVERVRGSSPLARTNNIFAKRKCRRLLAQLTAFERTTSN